MRTPTRPCQFLAPPPPPNTTNRADAPETASNPSRDAIDPPLSSQPNPLAEARAAIHEFFYNPETNRRRAAAIKRICQTGADGFRLVFTAPRNSPLGRTRDNLIGTILLIALIAYGWHRLTSWWESTQPQPAEIAQHRIAEQAAFTANANAITEFRSALALIPGINDIIARVAQGDTAESVRVTVTNAWHHMHRQERLQGAQTIQRAWALVRSRDHPDAARLELVDLNGNEVGGSRVWGGTLIWVQD